VSRKGEEEMIKKFAFLLFFALVLSACSPAESTADVEAAVKAAFQEYGASLEAGDADRWGALWTEDGVQMPPGVPANVGKEKIVSGLRAEMEIFAFSDMEISNEEVQVAGDWAYARGTYVLTVSPKDGSDPIFVDGKYMSIFQKQADGSWKLYRDIFNDNQ
jgi:uncharacterized protein (TIGR02246 family)